MKIKRNTSEQLIIADIPWIIGAFAILFILIFSYIAISDGSVPSLFFALIGVSAGGLAFVAFVRRTQVILDRSRNTILIRRKSVFGYSTRTLALSDLERAHLDSHTDEDGDRMNRAVLAFSGSSGHGRIPITRAYTNTGGPERAVEAINQWLGRNASA